MHLTFQMADFFFGLPSNSDLTSSYEEISSLQSAADQYTTVKNCKVWHITASEADYIVSLEGNKFSALLYAQRLCTGKLVPKPVL